MRPDLADARTARTNLRRRMARRPIAFVDERRRLAGQLRGRGPAVPLRRPRASARRSSCGSSVGAIIAAKLAEGDDEETGRRAIDDVEAIWRGLRSNDDMWVTEPWLEKLRSQVNWASELRGRAGGARARRAARRASSCACLGEIVRNPPETDGTLDALRQAMRARSLLSMEPVRAMVERELVAGAHRGVRAHAARRRGEPRER